MARFGVEGIRYFNSNSRRAINPSNHRDIPVAFS